MSFRRPIPKARLKELMKRGNVTFRWLETHHSKQLGGVSGHTIAGWLRPTGPKVTEYFYIEELIKILEERALAQPDQDHIKRQKLKPGRDFIPKAKVAFYCEHAGIQIQQLEARLGLRVNELHWWKRKQGMKTAPSRELQSFFKLVRDLTPGIEDKWQASLRSDLPTESVSGPDEKPK